MTKMIHSGAIAGSVVNLATQERNAKIIGLWQLKIKPIKVKLASTVIDENDSDFMGWNNLPNDIRQQ